MLIDIVAIGYIFISMARKWTEDEKQRLIRGWGAESVSIRYNQKDYHNNEVRKTAYA